ncbi:MAG: guanosine monophosphate reductase [Candidatus Shapirobacteria bacterium]|jgi:IMP dehydrogenase
MKLISTIPELTFNDVLLLPGSSDFDAGEDTQKTSTRARLSKHIYLDSPICSAPMPHLTEVDMAITMGKLGGIGFLHCFQDHGSQLNQTVAIKKENVPLAVSVSDFSQKGFEHVSHLLKQKVDLICLETANGFTDSTIDFLKRIKSKYPNAEVCVALVVTGQATLALIKAGADSIRVGIGGGSHCTTRLVTGVGRPQLSAIADCYKVAKKYDVPIISDTGIQNPGDIAKAIAFGADTVMIGGLFTGTQESPGQIIRKNGKFYKFSAGMCSPDFQYGSKFSFSLTELKGKIKSSIKGIIKHGSINFIPHYLRPFTYTHEGVSALIPYKGSVTPIFQELVGGLRRSMWYLGVHDINSLRKNVEVVVVTHNTQSDNIPRI